MMCRRLRSALDGLGASARDLPLAGATVPRGPAMITDPEALAAAAPEVLDLVAALSVSVPGTPSRPPVVVVAAFGDPGVPQLVDAGVPVVGIGGAGIRAGAAGGRRFAVATTTPGLVDSITGLVERTLGPDRAAELFTGVVLTATDPLVLAADPAVSRAELADAVERARASGARRVVIGGGPLSDAAEALAGVYADVVVEPVAAAAVEALALVAERDAATSRQP